MTEPFSPIKRSVMIVSAKEPFIDWIFSIREAHYGQGQVSREDIKKRAAEKKNAYLIPAGSSMEPDGFIGEKYAEIFENELRDWCLKTGLWPENRSREVFREWLGYEFHPVVFDTVPGRSL